MAVNDIISQTLSLSAPTKAPQKGAHLAQIKAQVDVVTDLYNKSQPQAETLKKDKENFASELYGNKKTEHRKSAAESQPRKSEVNDRAGRAEGQESSKGDTSSNTNEAKRVEQNEKRTEEAPQKQINEKSKDAKETSSSDSQKDSNQTDADSVTTDASQAGEENFGQEAGKDQGFTAYDILQRQVNTLELSESSAVKAGVVAASSQAILQSTVNSAGDDVPNSVNDPRVLLQQQVYQPVKSADAVTDLESLGSGIEQKLALLDEKINQVPLSTKPANEVVQELVQKDAVKVGSVAQQAKRDIKLSSELVIDNNIELSPEIEELIKDVQSKGKGRASDILNLANVRSQAGQLASVRGEVSQKLTAVEGRVNDAAKPVINGLIQEDVDTNTSTLLNSKPSSALHQAPANLANKLEQFTSGNIKLQPNSPVGKIGDVTQIDSLVRSSATSTTNTDAKVNSQDAKQVIAQIKFGVNNMVAKNEKHITVQLSPRELGNVDVHLKVSNEGKTQVMVMAERSDTLSLLQRESSSLKEMLQDALKTESSHLSFTFKESDQHQQQNKQEGGAGWVDAFSSDEEEGGVLQGQYWQATAGNLEDGINIVV